MRKESNVGPVAAVITVIAMHLLYLGAIIALIAGVAYWVWKHV